MSGRAELFLGIIALTTLVTAIVQVVVLIGAGLLARRVQRTLDRAEKELRPMFDHLNMISRDAARAASLAVVQVERADRLFADVAQRVEQTVTTLQAVVAVPVREGAAVLSAFRAVMSALRDARANRNRARVEDEDALFI